MNAQNPLRRRQLLTLALGVATLISATHISAEPADQNHDYDIVYVRAPRYGDEKNTRWPEVKDPIRMEPGADLMLLKPDGTEEVLVEGGNGSVVDPYLSFDAKWVYYSLFHDQRPEALNRQRRDASTAGADIFKINLETREIIRLTHQEFTPNTGVADWAESPTDRSDPDKTTLGYGVFNLGPCPLPGGKIMFTSSRNGYLPNKSYTFPNLQLFVMDEDGKNVELIGHLNLGSALHPTMLVDGRVMFSSYEAQGLRDQRLWSLWAIRPDGTEWEPLVSAMSGASAYHFQTQLSKGDVVVDRYYNQNNNGFGTLWSLPPRPTSAAPPFADPNPRHESNPLLPAGWHYNGKIRYSTISFSPQGLQSLTQFTFGEDSAAPKENGDGEQTGKVTHPSSAPENDLLLVWSPGPANDLRRPTTIPFYDGGIYRIAGGGAVASHRDLIEIKNDPNFNEMQPRPVSTFREIYGVDEPQQLPDLANDGSLHDALPEGSPFGLVGTSSFYKRNTAPGYGAESFDGLDPFNTSQNGASPNWFTQGADAGKYEDADIHAVRILTMEPTSHLSYGRNAGKSFSNHANERLRILGEIPLRKFDKKGEPILDPEGNPDTSFLAKIPADVPFTFQTIDKNGMVLNASQTWHQVRPGELRVNCGGCHAHAQQGLGFDETYAAGDFYELVDLTKGAQLLGADGEVEQLEAGAVDVEFYRDIKPVLNRSCVQCHSMNGPAEAELVLNDEEQVGGYDNTWHRLANDSRANYGRKPVIKNGSWRQTNASRYVRKFQSRRSLLIWKIFGQRLDGWTNEDHPTELVAGDASTLPEGANPNDADLDFDGKMCPPPGSGVPPLSAEEKLTFARWIDLGAPISRQEPQRKRSGWFADELRPTLTLNQPKAGANSALDRIVIGMHDYYSGLDANSLEVTADFPIGSAAAGENLAANFKPTHQGVWEWKFDEPIPNLESGVLTISVRDSAGNTTEIERTISVQASRPQ